jgi:hypothetical protein
MTCFPNSDKGAARTAKMLIVEGGPEAPDQYPRFPGDTPPSYEDLYGPASEKKEDTEESTSSDASDREGDEKAG